MEEKIMGTQTFLGMGLPVGLGLAALGSGVGLGLAVLGAMNAMGRQPEASKTILVNMIIGCAFIEAITLYVLVYAFMLTGKI
jgi:F-type H+-transporting ATPase subunit c